MKTNRFPPLCLALAAALLALTRSNAQPQMQFSELMYHPVERAAFDTNGTPLLDISDDVHEFVELHNTGDAAASLDGWHLSGGIAFDFPAGITVAPSGFVVIAKNPARLAAIPQYGLTTNQILGPYSGQLGNSGDTIRLRNLVDEVVDSVSYSPTFPWAIGADALGADDEWTGLNSTNFQYRGRSLERVSFSHSANDPANWLASPLAMGPTPRRTNTVQFAIPRPVVVAFSAVQETNGQPIIRSNQPVRLDVSFSATNQLSNVSVEYFADNINATNETRFTVALSPTGAPLDGRYAGTLPGQADRTVVRYRIRADRGAGVETVSPRADDPYAWHAYFVTPQRAVTAKPVYEVFISTASLNTLNTNITQSPRRVTLPDPPGNPRESWNDTEPAIFAFNGEVFDIQMRHHGSRYNRGAGRNSFKWQFPRYQRFGGRESLFITDKGEEHRIGSQFYDTADFPAWRCRYVDLYLNNNSLLQRLEQEEMDDTTYRRWDIEQAAKYPGRGTEGLGGIFKATGVIPFESGTGQGTTTYFNSGEGPYFIGNCTLPPAKPGWSIRQRCEWTYGPQINGWKGGADVEELLTGLWAARGDSPVAPNPNLAVLRAFLEATFDVERTLTYIAIRDWSGPFDNATHNYFLWRRANGRWAMVPWDLDSEFDNPPQTIFWDEYVSPQPDTLRGPHWIKDSFYKAFRNEYKQKLWILNNTLLNPATFPSNGWSSLQGFANGRQTSVNTQLGLGPWYAPQTPVNLSPAGGAAFPPAALQSSPYAHTDTNVPAHASTTWLIRSANGGYTNPVARVTITTNLTSLPIPFDELAFGQTYFWKCLYTDTNGHPSSESIETSFIFGAGPVGVTLVPIETNSIWRYNQSGTNPPANWNQPGFDDTAWLQGAPLFADETGPLPAPVRTTLVRSNVTAFYFRTSFVFPGETNGVTLRLRPVVDDGVVIYLNGIEVLRRRMPVGTPTATTPANAVVGDAVFEGPFNISTAALLSGANVLAAEVHQATVTGNDVVFGLTLDASVPSAPGAIRLNEILADNGGSVLNGGPAPDYVELFNVSGVPQALDQFSLSDNPDRPGKFVFPPGTIIPAQGFLTVWCDDATNAPGLHTGFALDNDGQTVALFAVTPSGYLLTDALTFGLQVPDRSIGRVGNTWDLNAPTPNAANVAAVLGAAASLKVNEWMATSTTGPDWFELFNPNPLPVALGGLYLSDSSANRTNTRLASLSFIAGRGFRQFIADENPSQNARHVDFRLSASGDSILLSATNLSAIDTLNFGAQAANVSQGRLSDGGTNIVAFPGSESPEAPNHLLIGNIVINEVAPDIELRNAGAASINIGGWWLSDDPLAPEKYRIPDGTVVATDGYWSASQGLLPFQLDLVRGGRIVLSHDGTHRLNQKFGPFDGRSQGTVPTSVGTDFARLSVATFGGSNGPPQVGPVVMSEIQYHPADLPADDDDYEFIELANITAAPVNLFLAGEPGVPWRLRDAVSFSFPSNTTLAAGEYVLVLPFDPSTNSAALSNFQAVYFPPPEVRLFGPYSGKLDNAGDSVELIEDRALITTPGPDFNTRPALLLERVNYGDATPWPAGADGLGASLQRRQLAGYGNEPTNWFASGVTAGGFNRTNTPPTVAITSPANAANFGYGLPIPITADALDADGVVRVVDFFADGILVGTDSSSPFGLIWTNAPAGPHTLTARARDNRVSIVTSAPVTLNVINQPPVVSLTSPTNGSFITLPTNILLHATADDSDGVVTKVEFFANGARLGEVAGPPYSLVWTNPRSGAYSLTAKATDDAGTAVVSASIAIVAARQVTIAYVVDTNTVGTQSLPNPYSIGMDFDVLAPVIVTHLGCFDSGSDGISPSSALTTQIFNRNGVSPVVVASTNFLAADPGVLIGGSRFKALATPIVLTNGSYSVVGYGYDGNNRNGNLGTGNVKTWITDDGGGLLAFVGGGRFGAFSPGGFPTTLDGGPADRYAAGTFILRRITPVATIVSQPANLLVRPAATTNLSVVAIGDAPLRYQWSFNGVAMLNATNSILTLANIQATNEGVYRVAVSNSLGGAVSGPATLGLLLDLGFALRPVDQIVVSNGSFTVTTIITGGPPLFRYEWREQSAVRGFTNSDSRTNFFTFGPVINLAARVWRVVVTNAATISPGLNTTFNVTALADTDADGQPDIWETANGLNPNDSADRNADADGDGMKNRDEYDAGTDPNDPASYLRIDSIAPSGGATVRFGAVSNRTYTLQFSDAVGSGLWQKFSDIPARTNNRVEVVVDPNFAANRFYRVTTPRMP